MNLRRKMRTRCCAIRATFRAAGIKASAFNMMVMGFEKNNLGSGVPHSTAIFGLRCRNLPFSSSCRATSLHSPVSHLLPKRQCDSDMGLCESPRAFFRLTRLPILSTQSTYTFLCFLAYVSLLSVISQLPVILEKFVEADKYA